MSQGHPSSTGYYGQRQTSFMGADKMGNSMQGYNTIIGMEMGNRGYNQEHSNLYGQAGVTGPNFPPQRPSSGSNQHTDIARLIHGFLGGNTGNGTSRGTYGGQMHGEPFSLSQLCRDNANGESMMRSNAPIGMRQENDQDKVLAPKVASVLKNLLSQSQASQQPEFVAQGGRVTGLNTSTSGVPENLFDNRRQQTSISNQQSATLTHDRHPYHRDFMGAHQEPEPQPDSKSLETIHLLLQKFTNNFPGLLNGQLEKEPEKS